MSLRGGPARLAGPGGRLLPTACEKAGGSPIVGFDKVDEEQTIDRRSSASTWTRPRTWQAIQRSGRRTVL